MKEKDLLLDIEGSYWRRYVMYFIFLPTYLPTHLPIYLPTYLPTFLSACLPACLSTYLPIETSSQIFNHHYLFGKNKRVG